AGLRSFRKSMPEEVNRLLTDHLSELLFAPTRTAVENLAREGITAGVHMVGDIMADTTRQTLERPCTVERPPGTYLLLTMHRAENTDDPARLRCVLDTLDGQPEPVVFPCHPRTRAVLERQAWQPRGSVRLRSPVSHRETLELARYARLVLTDSGGLQKEAYLVGTPCLTLREETEWVETVAAGWNRLVGVRSDAIRSALNHFTPPAERPPLYGDGRTSERILDLLAQWQVEHGRNPLMTKGA
ncbi:MAG: UDP-N-acetylglucosamine 2-epimerase, partial [Candidatus Eremiobacterota bacterium]